MLSSTLLLTALTAAVMPTSGLPPAPASVADVSPILHLRPRAEMRDAPNGTRGDNLLLTARFGAAARVQRLTLRAVGQTFGAFTKSHTAQLYEGTVTYTHAPRSPNGMSWWLRAGRQVLSWHEMRLQGHRLFRPNGLTHDGLRFRGFSGNWRVDGFAGYPGDGDRPFAALRFGHKGKMSMGALTADAVYVRDGVSWSDAIRHTFGVYAKLKRGPMSARLESYGQVGKVKGTDVTAMMVSTLLTYTAGRWTGGFHADYLSGDEPGKPRGSGTFDVLHGGLHPFYGQFDVAYRLIGGRSDGRGLIDGGLRGVFKDGPWRVRARASHLHFADFSQLGADLNLDVGYRFGPQSWLVLASAALVRPDKDVMKLVYVMYGFTLRP